MKKFIVATLGALVIALSLAGTTLAAPAQHKSKTIPEACIWDLLSKAGPFYFNGPGYLNIHETAYLYGCYVTGGGFNNEMYAETFATTGNSSECNYAFSARVQGDNGSYHFNPAGQASTVGCYDGNGDADDEVTLVSPIEDTFGISCYFAGFAYASAFYNATNANSGGVCP